MSKRIFDKIPLLLYQNGFRSSNKILLQPLRYKCYNLNSTYNNKSFIVYSIINNVPHLRYYSPSSDSNNDVSFSELQQLLKEKDKREQKNVCIVDVREPFEFIGGHIPFAINIPLNQFEEAVNLSEEDFDNIYGLPKFNKDDQIILYCKSGQRSMIATAIAKYNGFTRARNYPGSWLEYSEKN